jgi:hypothetical protein
MMSLHVDKKEQHLRGKLKTQSLGADGDFDVKKWSKKHYANVAKDFVDK